MDYLEKVNTAVTHAGKFHADDVFAAALISLIHVPYVGGELVSVRRVNDVEIYRNRPSTVIFDIGGGEYDHHQPGAPVRKNGVKYAAFGLLFRDCWHHLFISKEEAVLFDKNFVQMIDNTDNTGKPNPISAYINTFMPTWDDPADVSIDQGFMEAVNFAKSYIRQFVKLANSRTHAESILKTFNIVDGYILDMSQYIPYNKWAYDHGIIVAVFPSMRGGFNASVVSDRDGNNLALFPESWRGAKASKLKEMTGIKTLHFCHHSGFMVATETREDAIEAAKHIERVISEENENE